MPTDPPRVSIHILLIAFRHFILRIDFFYNSGVAKYLTPAVAGFLLQKELDYLQGAVDVPKRPFAAIVGGSKVSSKITVIETLLNKVDKLVLGGGMVFTFLKARGIKTGKSLVEDDQLGKINFIGCFNTFL